MPALILIVGKLALKRMLLDWIKRQKELLSLEAGEETQQLRDKITQLPGKQCERDGLSIVNLELISSQTTLFGRSKVEFQKLGRALLPSGLKVNDEVNIRPVGATADVEPVWGLIKKISPHSIEVVVEEYDEVLLEPPLRLDLCPSRKTHEKMMAALDDLGKKPPLLADQIYDKGYPIDPYTDLAREKVSVASWFSSTLNESQQEAVTTALSCSKIGIIHGPPGTGKTSTLVELILQSVMLNQRVLISAPSNIAVDTILMRLVIALDAAMISHPHKKAFFQHVKANIVRLGHPVRLHPVILSFSLDSRVATDDVSN